MASIDTTDSIEILADAGTVFDVILNYPEISSWFPSYRCRLIGDESQAKVRQDSRVDHIVGRPPFILSHFVRTIRHIVPGERIEETYDEGDLRGTGTWSFVQNGKSTTVSYHCAVESRSFATWIGFLLTGSISHNMVYKYLLRALKKRCES